MTPRQTAFAEHATRNRERELTLATYLKLRKLGWSTRKAWILAQGGEVTGEVRA